MGRITQMSSSRTGNNSLEAKYPASDNCEINIAMQVSVRSYRVAVNAAILMMSPKQTKKKKKTNMFGI
jgi:hypothetical protein